MKERESDILRTIMDGLTAMKILHFRMNSGGMFGQHNGKRWAVKFGMKGMADVLAFVRKAGSEFSTPYWIEVKTDVGQQSEFQKCFQQLVEAHGHVYLLTRNWETVRDLIQGS